MSALFQSPLRTAASIIGFSLLTACASNTYGNGVFSYSKDRCLGAYNQCRNNCPSIDSGPAQSACYERCLDRQSQCYSVGDDGAGSSLSQESLIGYSKSQEEKEAEYQRWKANKEKEDEADASQRDEPETP